MRRTRLVGAVAALLVLSLLLLPESRPPRAQTAPAPATGAARMVVVAESGGVIALNAADAAVLFELADPAGVRAVGADEPRGRVWAYSPGTLRAHRLDGTTAVTVALPLPPGYTSTTPVSLVVHPEDGSVWLSVGPSLQHLDAQGTVLLTLTFGSPIRVLALDPPRSRIFVGTATSLAAYSDSGQVVASVALGGSTLLDAVVEPTSGHLFAALDTALRRYDLTGAIVLNVLLPLSSQRWVARDGAGGAWAATQNLLVRISSTGQLAVFQYPWSGPGPIVGLAADPTDQTAWVGSSPGAVTHVGPTGAFLHQLALFAGLTVRDLAFMRDLVPPVVSFTAPVEGAALNTGTPHLELSYSDLGAGVDPVTLALTAEGQALAASCTPAAASATCTPATALPDGAHALAATVKDKAANLSPPAQVQVTIDTVAPVVTLSAPAEGLLTTQASQTVSGSVSETATLVVRQVVNGTAVQTQTPALSPTNTFTSSPVTLAEGSNLLEVIALDAAGNRGAASRTVTLDTLPPPAVAAIALSVGPVTAGQVVVSGAAGSAEPGAQVTITNTRTGVAVTVVAAADGSFSGSIAAQAGDQLSVTATDAAGNTSAPAAASVPAAVQVAITEPAAGATVAAGDLLVRGTVDAGATEVGVVVNGIPGAVHGTTFAAVVPVTPGTGTLTAVAGTASGATSSHSVPVVVTEASAPAVVLHAAPARGVAPLATSFSLLDAPSPGTIELDLDGNGIVDFSGPTLENQAFTYAQPGLYVATATVTDATGSRLTASTIVQVYDRLAVDTLLQGKWSGMKDALRDGDIPRALTFVAVASRPSYDALFRVLAARLSTVDTILTGLTLDEVDESEVFYEMTRTDAGVTKSFEVQFSLDEDGIWRLGSF